MLKKRFIISLVFFLVLLGSIFSMYTSAQTEINWYNEVMNAMQGVPENKQEQARVIYDEFADALEKREIEHIRSWQIQDPELDKCINACGPNPRFITINPEDIDLDNPADQVNTNKDAAIASWDACYFNKCQAEATARQDEKDKQFNDDKRVLAEKAIADINALKGITASKSTTPSQGNFNTNSNRGRDEFGRINPSIGGYLGNAYVMRSDGTKVIPGKELYLKVEDRIVTGANSKLNFIFKDVGGLNLGENTQLRVGNALLDQYYLARGSLKTQLNWGTLPPQKLEFHTPNAVISTKGTEFVIDYNETTNITRVYLNEGVLEINLKNEITDLTAGNYLVIYSDGTTQTNQLESENWNNLGNNFYEIPDANKITQTIIWVLFIIDIITILILTLWMGKKIKNPNKNDKSTTNGTASFVLGILGIVLLITPYIGVILSTVGLFLARIQKVNKPTKSATAGFILGLLGLILNMIILIMML